MCEPVSTDKTTKIIYLMGQKPKKKPKLQQVLRQAYEQNIRTPVRA